MASLLNLPDELLLQVAVCLSTTDVEEVHGGYEVSPTGTLFRAFRNGQNPDTDLRQLCLTARRLRQIACEVLYRHPKLPSSAQPALANRTAPLVHLLRTFVNRPDLARFVHNIDLLIHPRCSGHSWKENTEMGVDRACYCGYEDLASILEQIVERQEMRLWLSKKLQGSPAGSRNQRYRYYGKWMQNIRYGDEPALAGLIVHLVPNLEHLNVRSFAGHAEDDSWAETFDPTFFFGIAPGYSPSFVPGFANLKSLTSNLILPWSVITMPTLKTLEYDFHYYEWGGLFVSGFSSHDPSSPCSNITALVLNFEVKYLENYVEADDLQDYVRQLLERFTAVERLHARTFYQEDVEYRVDEHSDTNFSRLAEVLFRSNFDTVKEFVVDGADMGVLKGSWQEPFLDVLFPNLRRLVSPQNALFEFGYDIREIRDLPSTIETIEVIDSTRLLNGWARNVLKNRDKLPHLRRIVLWRDYETTLLAPEKRLRGVPSWYDAACGRDPMEIEQERQMETGEINEEYWKPFDWVGDEIWEQVQDSGIEVITGQGKRGWRKLSR